MLNFKRINKISSLVTLSDDLRTNVEKILDELMGLVKYWRASVQVIIDDKRQLLAYRGFDLRNADEWLIRPIDQDALLMHVVSTKEALILTHPKKDSRWDLFPSNQDVKSWVCIPLVDPFQGNVFGFLTIDNNKSKSYKREVIELFSFFASQITNAIVIHKLFGLAKNNINTSEIIRRNLYQMQSEQKYDNVLRMIIHSIGSVIEFDTCAFYDVQHENDQLEIIPKTFFRVGAGFEDIPNQRIEINESIIGYVALTLQSLMLKDIRMHPRFKSHQELEHTTRAFLVTPIIVNDNCVGVISVGRDTPSFFDQNEIQFLDILSQQVGILFYKSERYKFNGVCIEFTSDRWGQLTPIEYALAATLGKDYIIEQSSERIIVKLETPEQFQAALDAVIPVLVALEFTSPGEVKSLEVYTKKKKEIIQGDEAINMLREIHQYVLSDQRKLTIAEESIAKALEEVPFVGGVISLWMQRWLENKSRQVNQSSNQPQLIFSRFVNFFKGAKGITELTVSDEQQKVDSSSNNENVSSK